MLMGKELKDKMTVLPEYDESIRTADAGERLVRLGDIYSIYIPSAMTVEIYSKIYLAMLHSLKKKTGIDATRQRNENFRRTGNGIIGGSDSFTIIGCSGIGKSSAIAASIDVIGGNEVIEKENPYMRIVPILSVQCPFDCSVKSLLLSILKEVDKRLDTNFHEQALKIRATTDVLISSVSQCCINNIGLLVVDEIQNIMLQKNGGNLIGCLTQLINSSGISIAMVGTPEVTKYFSREMQLARRSLGLQYGALEYDDYFSNFCRTVFHYQYVSEKSDISDGIVEWLYEHSAGIISVVISLIHDAQEIAIISGRERLDVETLNLAYDSRMKMLHEHIDSSIVRKSGLSKKKKTQKIQIPNKTEPQEKEAEFASKEPRVIQPFELKDPTGVDITEISEMSKGENADIVDCLKESITVIEIEVA